MSASSIWTTSSSSFSRYSCASSAIESGIATGSPSFCPFGLMYAHMWRTSTMPSSSCSEPIGMCTATHFEENCSWICPSVRKKSARSRSSMLTTSTRASPSSSASFLTRAVPTSKPMTPETTTSAPSTTRSAQRASPWKDGSPGQSTRLIFRPCHSVWVSESEIETARRCSSSSESETVVPASIEPRRLTSPVWNRSASTRDVFPVPR